MIKGILFNTDMVRAILDGRKTVTRRICKDANEFNVPDMSYFDADRRTYAVHNYSDSEHAEQLSTAERTCPICPGDILYVRETWCGWHLPHGELLYRYKATDPNGNKTPKGPEYDEEWEVIPWRPSIHMPKAAARIWLKVTDVRVERLEDITDEQAKAEGANWKNGKNVGWEEKMRRTAIDRFAELWNSTIKKSDLDRYGWDASPWVWVIEFERCEKPEEV